uniref:Uncharacterized protein n=1 Tax=Setaria italica TaxID=4555 RepID=K3Y4F5_SETIT
MVSSWGLSVSPIMLFIWYPSMAMGSHGIANAKKNFTCQF